ncbi:unnamed protein product [Ceutorhynchus assimilis]|uniref:Uncharacterized protein n=1 Tax=Ceutorhynchus assimilis TaxID=467358 RepID=A0A9N9MEK8_9CUCU|nr:unnamed protein product [Ceutorhynchus assimilis]
MRQTIFLASFLLGALFVVGQQQKFPAYSNQTNLGWPSKFNSSNNNWAGKFNSSNNWAGKFNSSNNWAGKFNSSNNRTGKFNFSNNNWAGKFNSSNNNYGNKYNFSSYRPINQFPNSSKFNFSRAVLYNTTSNGTNEGHLFLGQIQMYDRLLFSQVYRKESHWWTYRTSIIDYPQAGAGIGYARISAIRCYNQFVDGHSAKALLRKGGLGYSYVQICLESGWNKGFEYLVQIYGH